MEAGQAIVDGVARAARGKRKTTGSVSSFDRKQIN